MVLDVNNIHSFLDWLNMQPKDYMRGEFIYNVKGSHTYLKQKEMFDYWLEHIYSQK